MKYRIEPPLKYKVGDIVKFKNYSGDIVVGAITRITFDTKSEHIVECDITHYGKIIIDRIICKMIEESR